MMKQGINYGFRTEKAERLADFNRDGTIDRNDAVSLMQFLTAQT